VTNDTNEGALTIGGSRQLVAIEMESRGHDALPRGLARFGRNFAGKSGGALIELALVVDCSVCRCCWNGRDGNAGL